MSGLATFRASLLTLLMIVPVAAWAQQTGSIAGTVKDTSGAVLPGVTVEATSPALIEKVRTAATDTQGEYKIINLRPGLYTVTVTLQGFSTVKRENIGVFAGSTVEIQLVMPIGGVQETLIVSGAAPLVDVQNASQHNTIERDLMDALPTGRAAMNFAQLIPGMVGYSNIGQGQDEGGNVGEQALHMSIHGSHGVEMPQLLEGMSYSNLRDEAGGSSISWSLNSAIVQEVSVEVAGHTTESKVSGPRINAILKDGGNTFRGDAFLSYTDHNLEANNITPAIQALGVTALTGIDKLFDVDANLGGPIVKDKLWFFAGGRRTLNYKIQPGAFYNLTPQSFVYTPDRSQPGIDDIHLGWADARLTWQATPRNKISLFGDQQWQCRCHTGVSSAVSAEASLNYSFVPSYLVQVTYSSPVTNKLLIDAGATVGSMAFNVALQPGVAFNAIGVQDTGLGISYRSSMNGQNYFLNVNTRLKVAYVTGSHALEVGMQTQQGHGKTTTSYPGNMTYQFNNGVPFQLTEFATPYAAINNLDLDLGLFAQDQWTFKHTTVMAGLRFDLNRGSVPAQTLLASQFTPARNYAAVGGAPNWKDLTTRFGLSHDLFGDGKTAIKASFGKYLQGNGVGIANLVNPVNATVNSTTRSWTDSNGNFIPDCDLTNPARNGECGPLASSSFGQTVVTTTYDPNYLSGWGKRGYNDEVQVGLQQQIASSMSLTVDYTRHWYGNFLVVDNLDVAPTDYSPFCVPVPSDPRLPNGGGYQQCGYYNINPNKFGQTQNFVTFASNYGNESDIYNGVDVYLNARLPRSITLAGGTSTGHEVLNNCGVVGLVDNPAGTLQANSSNAIVSTGSVGRGSNPSGLVSPSALFCNVDPPFQTQFKALASVPLPWWGISASATFQSIPGPQIYATYNAPNAAVAPSLGRSLSGNATFTTVQLVGPGTLYGDRINQLDFRVAKTFELGTRRLQGTIDVYNLLNVDPILAMNNTYGANWQKPTNLLAGRFVKFGAQFKF